MTAKTRRTPAKTAAAPAAPRPKLVNAEKAGTELLADKVAAGLITESSARDILTIGFPFVVRTIANWRREGMSADTITEEFTHRAAKAKRLGRNLAEASAEFYLAVWKGMQEDLAVFVKQV